MTQIMLAGGPKELSPLLELVDADMPERVTVDHCGRHEHFDVTNRVKVVDGCEVPIFAWSHTTAIAE